MRPIESNINVPFPFILDDLAELNPVVGRMFGCYSVYVGAKIMLIMRSNREPESDNGVWIATTKEHHASLHRDLKSMRDIEVFGPGPTGWQNIPEDSDFFDVDTSKICQLILSNDPRIGKIPAKKKKSSKKLKESKSKKKK